MAPSEDELTNMCEFTSPQKQKATNQGSPGGQEMKMRLPLRKPKRREHA
jgi:hypothetical protein